MGQLSVYKILSVMGQLSVYKILYVMGQLLVYHMYAMGQWFLGICPPPSFKFF